MSLPKACVLPEQALLKKYALDGSYTDCFTAKITATVSQAQYVEAFYTSPLFKLERFLLSSIVRKPSTDLQAKQLAIGELHTFAAWHVEERNANQLLMCDFNNRTRSWLMTVPSESGSLAITNLYFGSAIVPIFNTKSGRAELGATFETLLGFHRFYSRTLLLAARARIAHCTKTGCDKERK